MNEPKSFSRRHVLASSTAIISAGALIAAPSAPARAAELEDLSAAKVSSELATPTAIADLGDKLKKLKKGKEGRNGATLRDFDRNPFLKPVLNPLSKAEQDDYKRAIVANGRGI
jgi:hypothetical protein